MAARADRMTSGHLRNYRLGYGPGALKTADCQSELGVEVQRPKIAMFGGWEVGNPDQIPLARSPIRWECGEHEKRASCPAPSSVKGSAGPCREQR